MMMDSNLLWALWTYGWYSVDGQFLVIGIVGFITDVDMDDYMEWQILSYVLGATHDTWQCFSQISYIR